MKVTDISVIIDDVDFEDLLHPGNISNFFCGLPEYFHWIPSIRKRKKQAEKLELSCDSFSIKRLNKSGFEVEFSSPIENLDGTTTNEFDLQLIYGKIFSLHYNSPAELEQVMDDLRKYSKNVTHVTSYALKFETKIDFTDMETLNKDWSLNTKFICYDYNESYSPEEIEIFYNSNAPNWRIFGTTPLNEKELEEIVKNCVGDNFNNADINNNSKYFFAYSRGQLNEATVEKLKSDLTKSGSKIIQLQYNGKDYSIEKNFE